MEDSLQEKEASVKEGSVEREECEETEKPQEMEGNFNVLYLFLLL